MKKNIPLILIVLFSVLFSSCSTVKIKDAYDETVGKLKSAEKMFEDVESLVTQKKFDEALAKCDEVIASYGSVPTFSDKGLSNYGALAALEKERISCLKRKVGVSKYTSRNKLKNDLVKFLKDANAVKLENVLSCGVGRAAPSSDHHEIVYKTLDLANELVALRKNESQLLPFTSSGSELVMTEGYNDSKARRFVLAFDKSVNEWYLESFLEGLKSEIEAIPASLLLGGQTLTPAQQQQMREDFAQYTDPDGLLSPDINPGINTTGNGLLYSSYYYLNLFLYNVLSDQDKTKWVQTVQACRKNGINGLYNRTPTKTDQEGPDDYIGIAASTSVRACNLQMANDIYQYGETTYVGPINWVFNNENPGQFSFSAWLGRMPQFLAHVQMATGRKPLPWRRTVWMGSVQFSGTKNPVDNQDIVLTYMQCATLDPSLRVMKLVAKDWKRRMLKNYPNGMKEVFAVYLNNPNHPLAKWALSDFPWER